MDRSLWPPRAGNPNEVPPGVPTPSPSSTPVLSKVRLMKQRKHGAAARGRPAGAPGGGAASGFNPFIGEVREKMDGWRPFDAAEDARDVGAGNGTGLGRFEPQKGEILGSVFAAGSGLEGKNGEKFGLKDDKASKFETVNSSSERFVFGAGETGGLSSKLGSKNSAGDGWENASSSSGKNLSSSGDPYSGMFVFGADGKNSSNLGRSSSTSFDESMASIAAEEIRKLNIDKSKGVIHNRSKIFGIGSSVFVESVASVLPEEIRKLNINTSGNDKKDEVSRHGNMGIDGKNVFAFGDSPDLTFDPSFVSSLPEEISKLHIKVSDSATSSGKTETSTSYSSKVDMKNTDFNNEIGASKLPQEMKKLNIDNSISDFGFDKSNAAEHANLDVDGKSPFVFGSREKIPGSLEMDKLPEEIKKLNLGHTPQTIFVKDGGNDLERGGFASSSQSEKSTIFTQNFTETLDGSTTTKFPDDMCKLNLGDSANDGNFEKAKYNDHSSEGNKTNSFVFSNIKNMSEFVGDSGVGILPNEMKSNSSGLDRTCSYNDTTRRNSIPMQFTFQAGSHSTSLGPENVPSSNSNLHFMPFNSTKGPTSSASVDFGFVSPGTGVNFTSFREGMGISYMDYHKPKDSSWISQDSMPFGLGASVAFNVNMGASKDARKKKQSGKLKQPASVQQKKGNAFISRQNSSQENSEFDSPESYSPMDFSPYEEILVSDQYSSKASVTSEEAAFFDFQQSSSNEQQPFSVGAVENLVSAAQHMVISEKNMEPAELIEDDVKETDNHVENSVDVESSFVEQQIHEPEPDLRSFSSTSDASINNCINNNIVETINDLASSTAEKQASDDRSKFSLFSNSDDIYKSNFTFATPSSTQCSVSGSKRNNRKKHQMKVGQDGYKSKINSKFHLVSPPVDFFSLSSSSTWTDLTENAVSEGAPFVSQTKEDKQYEVNNEYRVKQETVSTATASVVAQEACENWRLRGNQAYANGHLSRAEEYYSHGVDSIPTNEKSGSCMRVLMLCYSNHAATRMCLGRMREALNDCMMAIAIDPSFLKAQVRAANCHLALGETEEASIFYKKCLQLTKDDSKKVFEEASDGLRKAQQVVDHTGRSLELLKKRALSDVENALQLISEALLISPYSESLTEMKAGALLMLRRYEEVIKFCEQTLDSSEKNSSIVTSDNNYNDGLKNMQPQKIWRWNLNSKCYFYLGRLDEALALLQKHNLVGLTIEKYANRSLESLASLSATLQELLRLKAAGNSAFQAGRHLEAVEHYSAALVCSVESRPFAAICFCNRAAAYQALGQITDAIADCNLAIALDPNYPKAISRRATLYEMIRDYSQACNDLNRLISLLEKQSEDKNSGQPKVSGKSVSDINDLKRTQQRLAIVEDEARKGIPLDMYMIMGIESSSNAADIKKAYRKAALRHHPDKAGQLLVRGEISDDSLWKDVGDEVHMDADRLFKMIGEAYAVLSDPTKRMQYDAEEEMRILLKSESGYMTPKASGDYSSYSGKSGNMRESWNTWRSSGSSQHRWSGSTKSSRYF